MKHKLAALVPWMAMAAATAQPTPVKVAYAEFEPQSEGVLRIDEECWVRLDTVQKWGWRAEHAAGVVDLQVEGRKVRLPSRKVDGQPYIFLNEAARQLGALAWWEGDTFQIAGQIRGLSFQGSSLQVDATLSFRAKVQRLDNPRRLVIDLVGVATVPGQEFSLPGMVRMGQFAPNIVRIVVDDPTAPMPRTTRPNSARFLDLSLAPYNWLPVGATEPIGATFPDPPVQPQTAPNTSKGEPVKPRTLTRLHLENRPDGRNIVVFKFDAAKNQLPVIQYDTPDVIQIDFTNVVPQQALETLGEGSLVESVEMMPLGQTGTRIRLKTKTPLTFLTSTAADQTTVVLRKPARADGTLAGKRIVIDPGHGGHDSGCNWGSGAVKEKVLALAISRLVSEELTDMGASVIMTRNSDVYLTVGERPQIANRNRADLFVSVHINSIPGNNSRSGLITFFHMQDPDDRLLATCIYEEIAKINDMPDIGVWSDSKIYNTGFGVLRGAEMPATLLELGFINHSHDRKMMVNTDWQAKVAKAIARGIKVYIGDGKEESKP